MKDMCTPQRLYIVELKLDGSPLQALEQIEAKGCSDRFALCPLPVVKVGINFSAKERNIDSWIIA